MGLGKLKIADAYTGYFWPGCRIGCLKIGVLFGSFWVLLLDAFGGPVGSRVGSVCIAGLMLVVSLVVWLVV